ncbi:Adenylate cyclase [gamma proteobacterium HdN1]|nr:Adenylate cyclase [gamma proteobacterium HdN1]
MHASVRRDSAEQLDPAREIRAFHRFHYRLTALYGSAVIATLLVMVYFFYTLWNAAEISSLQQRLKLLSLNLAESIDANEIAKFPLNYKEMSPIHQRLVEHFKELGQRDADIDSIYILRPSNTPTLLYFFVDYTRAGRHANPGMSYSAEDTPMLLKGFLRPTVEDRPYEDEYGITLSAYAPLLDHEGRSIGLVGVDVRSEMLERIRRHLLEVCLAILLGALLVIVVVSIFVARSVREPLSRLIRATGAVAEGDLDVRVRMDRRDEFGLLGRYFDRMAEELKERQLMRDLFGRYISEDVAKSMLSHTTNIELGGQESVVTVLFSDLKKYTTISEQLTPMQMVAMINQYLAAMNVIIDRYEGCVIEFLGDGILAAFGVPQPLPNHAEMAVRCAVEMRAALEDLNTEWRRQGLAERWENIGVPEIECRIGLHTGTVVAGNLGSHTRMKYAVIGDTVNVASRLEDLNKTFNTSILLSEETRSRLPDELSDRLSKMGVTALKGRQQTLVCYSI